MAHIGLLPRRLTRIGLTILFLSFGVSVSKSSLASTTLNEAVQQKENFSSHQQPIVAFPTSSSATVSSSSIPSVYPNFPHIGLYAPTSSSGWPLVGLPGSTGAGANDPLNAAVMDQFSRYQYISIPAMPAADLRPDILTGLRQRNPNIIIYAYTMGSTTWCPGDSNGNIGYPANTYYHDYYLAVTGGDPSCASQTNRFLWMQDGKKSDEAPHNFGLNANLAHKDGNGNYDVAKDIADNIYKYGKASKNWDGIFIDVYCQSLTWSESAGFSQPLQPCSGANCIDYARAGYGSDNTSAANRIAFHQAWNDGMLSIASRLRALSQADGHPDYPIIGNCGGASADNWTNMNGWMRENFPFQQGGSWYTNMLDWSYGYLQQNAHFRAPQFNYVNTQPQETGLGSDSTDPTSKYNPYATTNMHYQRFGMASAALGNGVGIFDTNDFTPGNGNWSNWWFDEYGVNTSMPQSDPQYGHTAVGMQYTGWLGQPTSEAYAMLSDTYANAPDLLTTNQGFETPGSSPSQIPGWTTPVFLNTHATYERSTTDSAVGSAAAHATVTAVDNPAIYWATYLGTGNFPINAFTTYSVTFKAKASANLPITVALGNVIQNIPVDTTWRQYQAVLTPTNSVANGGVGFDLGLSTGEYWIDDVTVKVGALSMWRRDFDKGSVLINPTNSTITVQLDSPMKKIQGLHNPSMNDGSIVQSVTLNGTNTGTGIGDAIFLLSIDTSPPSAVSNLAAP